MTIQYCLVTFEVDPKIGIKPIANKANFILQLMDNLISLVYVPKHEQKADLKYS